jgi:xylulokinase
LFSDNCGFAAGCHIVKDRWGVLAYTPTGGAALEWVRNNVLNNMDYVEINREVEKKNPGADRIFFFPDFTGAACPTWSSNSRGTILGLNLNHDRFHIARAVMEGVSFNINWILETLKQKGIMPDSLKMQGGATKSRIWAQITAEITGLPVITSRIPDMACIGAAVLAGCGAGIFASPQEGVKVFTSAEETIEPCKKNVKIYSGLFETYKSKFNILKDIYKI